MYVISHLVIISVYNGIREESIYLLHIIKNNHILHLDKVKGLVCEHSLIRVPGLCLKENICDSQDSFQTSW